LREKSGNDTIKDASKIEERVSMSRYSERIA